MTESPFVEPEPFDSPFQELRLKRPRLAEAPVVSLVVKPPVSSLRPVRPSQHGIRRPHHQES